MNAKFNALRDMDSQIVYVLPVTVADLPDALREQIGNVETVYSVNRTDGARLALVRDRDMAFTLARQHDFAPVNAH
jgi:hypothetical protein